MNSPMIGAIVAWIADEPPSGWFFCEGQSLQVNKHPHLYAILGNKFGGEKDKTFNLPDLRGRTIVGENRTESNLTKTNIGEKIGQEKVNAPLPLHSHQIGEGMTADLSKGVVSTSSEPSAVHSTGMYGVPIADTKNAPTDFPANSDKFFGSAALPNGFKLPAWYTPLDGERMATTKPTEISVDGTVTPNVSATLSGAIPVLTNGTVTSSVGVDDATIETMQPSLVLKYIIAVDGILVKKNGK